MFGTVAKTLGRQAMTCVVRPAARTMATTSSTAGVPKKTLAVASKWLIASGMTVSAALWLSNNQQQFARSSTLLNAEAAETLAAVIVDKEEKMQQQQQEEEERLKAEAQQPSETKPSVPYQAIEEEYKYVLIGGGTASFSAMQAILEREPDAKILIIASENHTPYQRPPLSKELWNQDAEPESLSFKDWQGDQASVYYAVDETKVTVLKGHAVVSLDVGGHEVSLDDGRKVRYKKCLVATGGTPRGLPAVPESIRHRVTTYRTVDDFKHLYEVSKKGGKIVVVGGSFLGTELAFSLANGGKKFGSNVVSVYPEPSVLARVLPRYVADHTSKLLAQSGVQLRPNRIVTRVSEGPHGKVMVTMDNNEVIEADHVVVAVGIQPNTAIFADSGLEIDPRNGGIVVNSELEARTDVFVAGDVASYYDVDLGRRRVEHYDHAQASGRLAGLNMTGSRKVYKHQPMFWSEVGSTGFEAVGELDSNLDTVSFWNQVQIQSEGAPWYFNSPATTPSDYHKGVVYFLKNKRVVGVLLWNAPGKVGEARKVIAAKKKYTSDELKNLISL